MPLFMPFLSQCSGEAAPFSSLVPEVHQLGRRGGYLSWVPLPLSFLASRKQCPHSGRLQNFDGKGKASITLRSAWGCHSLPSISLFSRLAQLDESTRCIILAQYQKEAYRFFSSPTWSAEIKSCAPTQEAVHTSPIYSSLPTRPALLGGGLDSVNSYCMTSFPTSLHSHLLRISFCLGLALGSVLWPYQTLKQERYWT